MKIRDHRSLPRRRFLRRATDLTVLLSPLSWLGACRSEPPFTGLRVELDRLPRQGRVVLVHDELPVELRREEDTVTARSMLCTHQGCQVQWRPAQNRYHCPCHQGEFDADGHPVFGPPPAPLRTLPVLVERGVVYVDIHAPQAVP